MRPGLLRAADEAEWQASLAEHRAAEHARSRRPASADHCWASASTLRAHALLLRALAEEITDPTGVCRLCLQRLSGA